MAEPELLLAAARRILTSAVRDLERGWHESACVSAHRGAVLATEAWLTSRGQTHVSNSVAENVALSPGVDPTLRAAGARLDRHRAEESFPHRSGAGDVAGDEGGAPAVVDAGLRVLGFVERELGPRGGAERGDEVFDRLGADYAAARPGYPDALFAELWKRLPRRDRVPTVLDVAAGTGAATEGVLARPARAVSIEPALGMVRHAVARSAGRAGWLGAVAARAEALPVADGAADALVVGQAFHWLEPVPALDEFARVLGSGGVLAVFWNVGERSAFLDDVWALVERLNPGRKRPVTQGMRSTPAAMAAHPAFEIEPPLELEHERRLTADQYVRYAFSWSYVGGALAPDARPAFERELRAAIARHHGDGSFTERFVTVVHFGRHR